MSDFARANPGDPLAISAREWNAAMDAAKAHQQLGSGGAGAGFDGPLVPGLVVLVRNDTGDDLPAFVPILLGETLTGIVATPDALPYESRDKPLFSGLECDGAGVHAVTQEAIPDGEIGRAVVMGVTVARVASGLVAGDMCQAPTSGNVELIAGGSYAKLLTDAVGSGDRVALVMIGSGPLRSNMVVMATAPNDGQQWTTGLVQAYTVTGDLVAANPLETVEMRPLYPTDKLVNGQSYLCVDTGARGAAGRRRLRAERLGAGGAEGTVTLTVYRYACNAGRLVETPVTITLAGLGLRQVPP